MYLLRCWLSEKAVSQNDHQKYRSSYSGMFWKSLRWKFSKFLQKHQEGSTTLLVLIIQSYFHLSIFESIPPWEQKISLYRLFCGTPRAVAGKHFWEIRYKSVKRNSFSYSEFIVLLKKPVNKLVIAYLRRFSEEFCSCFVVIINVLRTLWYANDIVLFLKIFNN